MSDEAPLEDRIRGRFQRILKDIEIRKLMERAHTAGIPFSEAANRWTDDDIIWELAWDRFRADDALHRCQQCGIDPREMLKGNGRELVDDPPYRIQDYRCDFCEDLAERDARHSGQAHKSIPVRSRYVPAGPGDPYIPEDRRYGMNPAGNGHGEHPAD